MSSADEDDVLQFVEEELPPPTATNKIDEAFNEAAYLRAFPDVARLIESGAKISAFDHFAQYGIKENRLADARYLRALADETFDASKLSAAHEFPTCSIDAVFACKEGVFLIIGWIDDQSVPLQRFEIVDNRKILGVASRIPRCRRTDAEAAIQSPPGKLLGFWCIIETKIPISRLEKPAVNIVAGHASKTLEIVPQYAELERVREIAFEYFANARYFTNPQIESFLQISEGTGSALVKLSVGISQRIIANACGLRFGPTRAKYVGSIIVCLYGKAEFLFLQSAFFSTCPEFRDYEFIYVSNSPELTEVLQKEATIASRIYGVSITLVVLPGNAGFGAANNVAVSFARSDRILIVNPDVFPRSASWANDHRKLVETLPATQTAMFGVPLYYDDGSLMHAGMFFDMDLGLAVRPGGIQEMDMIRVEHYGKGAPPDTKHFLKAQMVPAVTGAFMSVDRNWYEKLGGFSLEYVFGHYEDADLCLKSYMAGQPVWIHNLPFWHLEGKGSTRRQVHEGGSLVNRWHFTVTWGDLIKSKFLGKTPIALKHS
jgi:GT2 family glycosyltransferase